MVLVISDGYGYPIIESDNPRPIIGYSTYDGPIRLIHYDLLPLHIF
jgi:hypothetical protein